MSTTRSYHTGSFFTPVPKPLHNLRKKVMFFTLMERGRHMSKKKKIYVAGLAFTVTNKYHIKDNLRSLQSIILAHNRHT